MHTVQETVHLMLCDDVQHTVCKRQGKHVCDCYDVELSIIDAEPYFPLFSRDYDYGAEPCLRFYWTYEPEF